MSQYAAPEPYGGDWKDWARRLNVFLNRTQSALVQQTGGDYIYVCTASHDGSANIWKRVALSGGAF